MNTWNSHDAQTQFSEVLRSCSHEPQVVYEQEKPVAVVLGFEKYKELTALESRTPTMAELHAELKAIREEEPDLEIPARTNRPIPALEED